MTAPAAGGPPTPAGGRKKPKAPGVVFSASAAALVVLVAAAFTPSQPPPPPTAEFAPAAQKPITVPPKNQTSAVGQTAKSGTRGGATGTREEVIRRLRHQPPPPPPPGAATSSQVIETRNVKDCVGSPARQIEDPESPPCKGYFKGDNGGATSTGVDKDSIKVVIADSRGSVSDALVKFFNKRFQFYGRQIVLVNGGCGESQDGPAGLKREADTIAQKHVFAVIGCGDAKEAEYPFYDELAHDGVVSVANRPDLETEPQMQAHHPYEWTFFPTYDVAEQMLGDIACSLRGKVANKAGAPYNAMTRSFGLITNTYSDAPAPSLQWIQNSLAACHIPYETGTIALEHSSASQGYSQNTEQQTAQVLAKFKQNNVTTVIDLVHAVTLEQITQVASSINYEPEHIMSSYLYDDSELGVAALPQDQTAHMFGESTWNPHITPQEEYWYQAVEEGQPGYKWTSPGSYDVDATNYYNAWYTYDSLLMLAAGIQQAGPKLTPQSFADGLQNTTFPNPDDPSHPEGKVSVHPGQHSYVADQSLLAFQPGVADPSYGAPGSFCYLNGGHRYPVGGLPAPLDFAVTTGCRRWGG